ncbi:hypothetical protein [Streptomyces sp. NPDC007063]|uniref:hypothetical protein n=1 Tax=Streptomyces sp. NPDC007063 TaxID=3364772 RepID=UPI0036B891E8
MTRSSPPKQTPPQGAEPTGRRATPQRLAELRGGPDVPQRPLDARALSALAANPGCRRRALLDGAGVDKSSVAQALGAPAPFGQSQFALVRGNVFEARVKADGGQVLLELLCSHTGADRPDPAEITVPELTADGPASRAFRTREALSAAEEGGWTLLDHPLLSLQVAGSTAYLEPDALAVHPDGTVSIIEIKSFPILDGAADPVKAGAAARQAAVYALALEDLRPVREQALLVCPKDFSNLPTGGLLPLRKQIAATRRQLRRLTGLEEIAAELPAGAHFAPAQEPGALAAAVEAVPAAYAPECLSTCELAFHCRDRARRGGEVVALGRSVRGELGGLGTVPEVLAAASGDPADPAPDPAAALLRRAAALRAEALSAARSAGTSEACGEDAAAAGTGGPVPAPADPRTEAR